jgi:hypothetical protein
VDSHISTKSFAYFQKWCQMKELPCHRNSHC